MKLITIIILSFLCFLDIQAQEKSNWSIEYHSGIPLNIPLPLTIKQTGQPDIMLNAEFYSEPLKSPIYWVLRLNRWKNNKAWEIELKHQKLYLKNLPTEVEYFNITHGYNQLILNRAYDIDLIKDTEFIYRFGLGVVIAHPENKVRGKEITYGKSYFDGYRISGPAFATSLSKHFKINERIYVNTEAKLSICYANVQIIDGDATVWHSAVEFIFGLGYRFIKK